MALAAGTRLGPYEILSALGAGGMGEVYRASDTSLRREVAIKVLPAVFASDPERLARFEREAHVLASLNHQNIAAIYGLERSGDVRFLVLELVEGPTLADRLASGPVAIPDALRLGTEIAAALEAAHEKGVIHRDLKPANVKLTSGGTVKVLDFGLAKTLSEAEPADRTHSPTMTQQHTRAGVLLGTAAYMSPEQAAGQPVDRRADVWAFGVLLYELLTGRPTFDGKTVSHIIVHVMEQEPDWAALPAALPPGVRELIERCLQKDATQRPRDMGDLRLQLRTLATRAASAKSAVTPPLRGQPPGGRRRTWLAWAVAGIATGVAASAMAVVYFRAKPAGIAGTLRFEIAQPGNASTTSFLSLSPDGRKLAFVAQATDGVPTLWVRSLDTLDARPLAGTERVEGVPAWSRDSRDLAFVSEGKLKKIDTTGGAPQTLCDTPPGAFAGLWTTDNRIILGARGGLFQVAAGGGAPSPLIAQHSSSGEFYIPSSLLPDAHHFIYSRAGNSPESDGTYVGSLDGKPEASGPKRLLAEAGAVYAPSPDPAMGYLLFVRASPSPKMQVPSGTLMAQPLDLRTLALMGEAVPIAEQVPLVGFSASETGVLAYGTGVAAIVLPRRGNPFRGQLTWFDRQGKVLSTAGEPDTYAMLTLSPDATRVSATVVDFLKSASDIWLLELTRGVTTRFTFGPARNQTAIWSPDGDRLVFAADRAGHFDVYQKPSNGSGSEVLLLKSDEDKGPDDWSRDGRFLAYRSAHATGDSDIWVLPMADAGSPAPSSHPPFVFLRTPFNERGARFSPDTRWIAYLSNESGKDEVYVRSFDPSAAPGATPAGGKWLVSKGGGGGVIHWRADGKELFYLAPDGNVMVVSVKTTPVFEAGVPTPLFKGSPGVTWWDVSPDGQKLLMPVPEGANSQAPYKIVLNWTATLKR